MEKIIPHQLGGRDAVCLKIHHGDFISKMEKIASENCG